MIAIREAEAQDGETVIALWHACSLTRPWNDPAADFARALAFGGSTVVIAEESGDPVGTAMVGFDGHRGWIYYLAVAPRQRGQGVARMLLDHCQHWLRERGCTKVELLVRHGNPAAEFYEHLGWEAQNVRVFARWLNESDDP